MSLATRIQELSDNNSRICEELQVMAYDTISPSRDLAVVLLGYQSADEGDGGREES